MDKRPPWNDAIRIRSERRDDLAGIWEVVVAAFDRSDEAKLVDRLRTDGDAVISLVAIEGKAVIGHVLFSRLRAPFRALGLAPVAVRPDRQRRGIGSRLIAEGLKRARETAWQGVFVVGDPVFYQRFGFTAELASGFASPYAGPCLMALLLGGAALPVRSGQVDYASAFADLG